MSQCGQVNKGVKVDLPEEKKVEEILSTEVEQALREKSRQEAERGELTWSAAPPGPRVPPAGRSEGGESSLSRKPLRGICKVPGW